MQNCFSNIALYAVPFISLLFGYAVGKRNKRRIENSGEAQVRRSLAKYCENRDAHALNNITLRVENGATTQIDHVLISSKGIFVIETKHYRGWIFASSKFKTWTQCTYSGKYKFQNPVFQNYKHIKAIQKVFDFIDPTFIHNIVVFSRNSIFKTMRPNNVLYIEELIPAIEKYTNDVLSLNRIQFCVGRLEYMRLELTRKTDIEHHAYLEQRFRHLDFHN